jgi:MFS family permease
VSKGFIALYVLAYMGTWLALMAPVLVTLALKVKDLVGEDAAPNALGLVAGAGAMIALVGNPVIGKLSDRTTSRLGMRRPWMLAGFGGGVLGLLTVAVAPNIPILLIGWCVTQLGFNTLLSAQVAVLPDQVPARQRGAVSGMLGIAMPVALITGTYVVQLVVPNQLAMFLFPAGVGGVFILLFAYVLKDRKLDAADKAPWSLREVAQIFYVDPRRQRDFAWVWASRFMFVLTHSFLTTYQAFYLIDHLGLPEDDVPGKIFLGTLVSSVLTIASSLFAGRCSDLIGRRKVFVLVAAVIFGTGLFVIASASGLGGFLLGMGIVGVGFGAYLAVDLALVTEVLPHSENAAKDLGVFNIASALPQVVAPAIAPMILAAGGGYPVLYVVAGSCGVVSALMVLKVRGVR